MLISPELQPGLFHEQFKRDQIALNELLGAHAPVFWTEHGHFPGGRLTKGLAAAYRGVGSILGMLRPVAEAAAHDLVPRRARVTDLFGPAHGPN